jgi:hypothetical protein
MLETAELMAQWAEENASRNQESLKCQRLSSPSIHSKTLKVGVVTLRMRWSVTTPRVWMTRKQIWLDMMASKF